MDLKAYLSKIKSPSIGVMLSSLRVLVDADAGRASLVAKFADGSVLEIGATRSAISYDYSGTPRFSLDMEWGPATPYVLNDIANILIGAGWLLGLVAPDPTNSPSPIRKLVKSVLDELIKGRIPKIRPVEGLPLVPGIIGYITSQLKEYLLPPQVYKYFGIPISTSVPIQPPTVIIIRKTSSPGPAPSLGTSQPAVISP